MNESLQLDADFFFKQARLSGELLLKGVMVLAKQKDWASLNALLDMLHQHGHAVPLFVTNKSIDKHFWYRPVVFVENRSVAQEDDINFTYAFMRAIANDHEQRQQPLAPEAFAFLDRVIALYQDVNANHEKHLNRLLYQFPTYVFDVRAYERLLQVVDPNNLPSAFDEAPSKNDDDAPLEKEAFLDAFLYENVLVSRVLLKSTDPYFVFLEIVYMLMARDDRDFADLMVIDQLLKVLTADPGKAGSWLNDMVSVCERCETQSEMVSYRPQTAGVLFRMVVLSQYLKHYKRYRSPWNPSELNALIGNDAETGSSRIGHALADFASSNLNDPSKWDFFHHHENTFSYTAIELDFVHAVLSSNCTDLLNLCDPILSASIHFESIGPANTLHAFLEPKYNPNSLSTFRFRKTLKHLLSHGTP